MAKNTKEKILLTALDLFSENGYRSSNLQEIADNVGIVKSALYRHFSSKEEIWNSFIEMMQDYYYRRIDSIESNEEEINNCNDLKKLTMNMVNFTIHDENIKKTRKVLLMEQFHDERVAKLASEHFITGLEKRFTKIFNDMMSKKIIKKCDCEMLALAYTAPITVLIHECDRYPKNEAKIIKKIERYIDSFISSIK